MTPGQFPPMVQPSSWTTVLFVAIVLGLVVTLVLAVARAERKWALGTAVGLILLLAVTGAAAGSGLLEKPTFPPG